MKIYLTTCRKPTQGTRKLAKFFERFFGWAYENRGKRSLEELVAKAEENGLSRLAFVYESHGNPSEIAFYEDGWLQPRVLIMSFELAGGKHGFGDGIVVNAESDGKRLAELFGIDGDEEGEEKAYLSGEGIILEAGENVLRLKIKVVNENHGQAD